MDWTWYYEQAPLVQLLVGVVALLVVFTAMAAVAGWLDRRAHRLQRYEVRRYARDAAALELARRDAAAEAAGRAHVKLVLLQRHLAERGRA